MGVRVPENVSRVTRIDLHLVISISLDLLNQIIALSYENNVTYLESENQNTEKL